MSDAIKEWNSATNSIKNTESLYQAKKEIKLYSKTLPIWIYLKERSFEDSKNNINGMEKSCPPNDLEGDFSSFSKAYSIS